MEEWKDEIINSIEGIKKAEPPADAFFKIQQKISQRQVEEPIKNRSWLAVAAVISLIMLSNVYFVNDYLQKPPEVAEETYPTFISTYSIY